MYTYIHTYIHREREIEREKERKSERGGREGKKLTCESDTCKADKSLKEDRHRDTCKGTPSRH
jgi:hypothetical protein